MGIIIVTYILNIIDYICTRYWIDIYGLEVEANPVGRWMFETNIAWFVKIFIVGAALLILHFCIKKEPKYNWTKWPLFIAYCAVTIYHAVLFCIAG